MGLARRTVISTLTAQQPRAARQDCGCQSHLRQLWQVRLRRGKLSDRPRLDMIGVLIYSLPFFLELSPFPAAVPGQTHGSGAVAMAPSYPSK